MTLTQKETTLLQDLKSEEQLCVEKYAKYSSQACDGALKNLLSEIGQTEQGHLNTINQLISGIVPQTNSGNSQSSSQQMKQSSNCPSEDKENDKFLCSDLLATEKHASSLYDTCIFEFKDANVRNVLNHIQKEEQQHGEKIYNYMSANGMYN